MLAEQKGEALRQKRELEELIEMPGWKLLAEAAAVQAAGRKNQVLLKPTENPLAQEYLKGEVNGIETFVRLPNIIIDSHKAVIDAVNAETGEEDNT